MSKLTGARYHVEQVSKTAAHHNVTYWRVRVTNVAMETEHRILFSSTSFCVLPHPLINGVISGVGVLEAKCVFGFLYNFRLKHFSVPHYNCAQVVMYSATL